MFALRICAAGLGMSLIIGETIRSWGQGRNPLFVLDDFILGLALFVAAWLMDKPSTARHCGLSAAFAAAAGMLYGSFFGKLSDDYEGTAGNFDLGVLTTLIGIAFIVSLIGLVTSLVFARGGRDDRHSASDPF